MSEETTETVEATESTETQSTETAQNQSYDIREFIDDKGNFVKEGWSKTLNLPESLEAKFKTIEGLGGSYASLEQRLRADNKVQIPNEHSSEEDWNAFYEKVGRPNKAEEYDLGLPEDIAGVGLDEEAINEVRAIAHKEGLTQKQIGSLGEWYGKSIQAAIEKVNGDNQRVHDEAISALKKEWGSDYDAKVASAEKGAAALGLTAEELKANPAISNNPAFIKAMAKAAEMVSEKPATALRQAGEKIGINTPEEAKAKIAEIRADKNHPYNNPAAPRASREQATSQMQTLYALAHPDEE